MVNINVDSDVDSDLYIPPCVIQTPGAEEHTRSHNSATLLRDFSFRVFQ